VFKINKLKENDFTIVELSNASKKSFAKICLNVLAPNESYVQNWTIFLED